MIEPAAAAGKGPEEIGNAELSDRISPLSEQAMLAMYHAQQARAWTANIIDAFETMMEKAGIHSRLERVPAICFLDITGYTRLTQEHGDDAAADLAATVARLVQRSSVQHGGKTIKWLGDGVMFYFRDPGPGVRAALEMVDGLAAAGLPPAHVGLHAGPVLFQQGDYFGQTVNLSARIADYARPGEVLVSAGGRRRFPGERRSRSARSAGGAQGRLRNRAAATGPPRLGPVTLPAPAQPGSSQVPFEIGRRVSLLADPHVEVDEHAHQGHVRHRDRGSDRGDDAPGRVVSANGAVNRLLTRPLSSAATMIVPNTCQPCPRTRSQERRSASRPRLSSITSAGISTRGT